jgi:hypothetical protein
MSNSAAFGQQLSPSEIGFNRLRWFLTSVPACVVEGVAWSIEEARYLPIDQACSAPADHC